MVTKTVESVFHLGEYIFGTC